MFSRASMRHLWTHHRKKLGLSIVSLLISTAILAMYAPFGYEKFAIANAVSWTGAGDGYSWSDGANWSGGSVPGANDDVTITGGTTVNIGASTTINSLELGNGTDATTLNFTYAASADGALILDEGNLTVTANATITHESQKSIYINVQSGNIVTLGTINGMGKGATGGPVGANGGGIAEAVGIHEAGGAGGGGGHGGAGGTGGTSGATGGGTVGSETIPTTIGAGGGGGTGASTTGGAGGGIVQLNAGGNITIGGVGITVRGNNGTAASGAGKSCGGGGSGGSIYITTAGTLTIQTNISVTASGGFGGNCTGLTTYGGGGGGGGRIALYYVALSNSGSITATGGLAGSGSSVSGSVGSDGTIYQDQYTVPDTPSIGYPTNASYGLSRNTVVTTSLFSGDLSLTATDWEISTASDDFTGTNLVAYKYNDTSNLTSITVNSTNFTFQNALAGKTQLGPFITYYVRARHKNAAGYSSYSSGTHSFTTLSNRAPATPSIIAPSSGATGQSRTLTLTTSAFSDEDPDDTHAASSWHIATDTDFTNIIARAQSDTTHLTSIIVNSTNFTFYGALTFKTQLAASTTYYARVGYEDSSGGASSFAPTVSFTTQANQNPNTPSITSPTDGATSQALNLTLQSTFSDPDPDDTHKSSDWEIYTSATPNADYLEAYVSGATVNKSSIGINASNFTFQNSLAGQYVLDVNTIYYTRTRHTDIADGQSSWSNLISFTTGTNMAPLKPSITSPVSGATGIAVNPTLTSSTFSDLDSGDTHTASQWEIYNTPNTISQNRLWYTSSDSVNLTSIIVNDTNGTFENNLANRTKLLPGTSYYARVLHMDAASANSEWAIPVGFTTVTAPADPTLASSTHPSETDFFESATPTFTITADSPTPDHYHYLVNQTISPDKLTVEGGTELFYTTFTLSSGTITEAGTWYVHIVAHDGSHNPSENFDTYTLKYDPNAPKISNTPSPSNITETTATISWITGNASNSAVNYGTSSGNYTQSVGNSDLTTLHQINLSGFDQNTVYYYTVTSVDAYGQSDTSTEQSFRTRATVAGGSSAGSSGSGSSSSGSSTGTNTETNSGTNTTNSSTTKKTTVTENGSYPKKSSTKTQETKTSETSGGSSQTTTTETSTTASTTTAETTGTTGSATTSTDSNSGSNSASSGGGSGSSGGGGSSIAENNTETADASKNEPTETTTTTEETRLTAFEQMLTEITDENDTQTSDNESTATEDTKDCSQENGEEDRDSDGLSDKIECLLGTEITNKDSDGDGISDGEEILEYMTDATDKESAPQKTETISKPSISNIFQGTLIADNTPLIQGTAEPSSVVTFILMNAAGERSILGEKKVEKEGKFLFEFPALLDGDYQIIIEQKIKGEIIAVSDPILISIQTDIAFRAPEIESFSGKKIQEGERLITTERRPKIIIKNPMPGGVIMAHWQSAIFASAILADSLDQTIAITPPKELEPGDHSVWVYAVQPKDNMRSKDVKLDFTIHSDEKTKKITFFETLKKNSPLLIVLLAAIGASIFFHLSHRNHQRRHKNRNTHNNHQSPRPDQEKPRYL